MNTTSFSLLHQLQQPHADNEASWRRFVEIYTPLLFQWSARLNVPYDDRNDLVQNTLAKLLLSITAYDQDTPGRFRGWLSAVLRNTWIDTQRKRKGGPVLTAGMEPVISDPLEETIDLEYRHYVLNRIRELVLRDFPRTTQMAFQFYVIDQRPAGEVAQELGMTENAVYLVRARVLRRIREELTGLID